MRVSYIVSLSAIPRTNMTMNGMNSNCLFIILFLAHIWSFERLIDNEV